METRSLIGDVMVASVHHFIVYGEVRGLIHETDDPVGAMHKLHDDRVSCSQHPTNGYSDAVVYIATERGWVTFLPDIQEDQ